MAVERIYRIEAVEEYEDIAREEGYADGYRQGMYAMCYYYSFMLCKVIGLNEVLVEQIQEEFVSNPNMDKVTLLKTINDIMLEEVNE